MLNLVEHEKSFITSGPGYTRGGILKLEGMHRQTGETDVDPTVLGSQM